MNIKDIEDQYAKLQEEILELQIRFFEPHRGYKPPDKEAELDLKSFCVLCHATFEDYAETLGIKLLQEIVYQFQNYKKISLGMISMMHFLVPADSLEAINQTAYDYLFDKLDKAKNSHSNAIHNNHGVSEEYLKNIFWPLGIEIPSDPKLMGSLKNLKNHRGEFAHHSPFQIKKSLDPKDLELEIHDVCELMGVLTKSVCRMMFYPWRQI